ncbi:class I SAM-dependent methyltransferase [bacterium]|nr:class I SAM-dependent methyltransferase [bacterium]
MDDRDVAQHWDDNAPEWVRAVRAGWDTCRLFINNPAFFSLLPDLRGQRVLDVGCGEGCNTRLFADLGAAVVGVDISRAMIAAAHQHEADEPRGIEYHVASGADLGRFADGSFDAVLSTMVMMDVADYAGCVREAHRVLKPDGLFQFSITHPCTATRCFAWTRDDTGRKTGLVSGNYFGLEPARPESDIDEWFFGAAPSDVRATARFFRVPRFFRTLSEYVNTLVDAGFTVTRLVEPYASDEVLAERPQEYDSRVAPFFLIFACHKRG